MNFGNLIYSQFDLRRKGLNEFGVYHEDFLSLLSTFLSRLCNYRHHRQTKVYYKKKHQNLIANVQEQL
ncbi:hypothetical protein QR98_0081430 [Sarcoptes scabiei]|uniref:Uncharacterized protein n=1 Tax=Sarcoptes scabiei TaxID=52283 RepID=A0A132AF42_SARSC|nr:hypothetical protein QR98_0081430 [Sarcoptes scabiei]